MELLNADKSKDDNKISTAVELDGGAKHAGFAKLLNFCWFKFNTGNSEKVIHCQAKNVLSWPRQPLPLLISNDYYILLKIVTLCF